MLKFALSKIRTTVRTKSERQDKLLFINKRFIMSSKKKDYVAPAITIIEDNEEFRQAAEGAIVRKGRAHVTIYESQDIDVRWPETDPSKCQTVLKKTKTGCIAKTASEKNPQYRVTAMVPANSADPAADILEQVGNLVRTIDPKAKFPKAVGRKLLNDETAKVMANKDCIQCYMEIPISDPYRVQQEFYNLNNRIASCLAQNQEYIKKLAIEGKK